MHRSTLLLLSAPVLAGAQPAQDVEPRLASKEEYVVCLDEEDELERNRVILTRRQEELKQLSAKFKAADDRFNAQVRQHAPSSKVEIQSYNRAIETRNKQVKEFNERGRALQREQSLLNTKVVEHNTKCGSLAVDIEIKDAVAQERKNRGAKR
jgi:chromosome segregation ATPase